METGKRKSLSFRTKLIVGMLVITIINTLGVGIGCYIYTYRKVVSQYYEIGEESLKQMDAYLTDNISKITAGVNALSTNSAFYDVINAYAENGADGDYGRQLGDMANLIYQFEMNNPLLDSLYIYTEYEDFDDFVQIQNPGFSFEDSVYYKSFKEDTGVHIRYFPAASDYVFKSVYPVIPIVYHRRVGNTDVYFCAALSTSKLQNYFRKHYSVFDGISMQAAGGEVLSMGCLSGEELSERLKESETGSFSLDGEGYILEKQNIRLTGWDIYAAKSRALLMEDLKYLRILVFAELSITVSIVILVGTFFINGITEPISSLAAMMRKAQDAHFKERFVYKKQDEIGQLAGSFNQMSDEINNRIEELNEKIEEVKREKENLKKEQEERRLAELKALRAQINPHFLYNTLNTISWQASSSGAKEASVLSTLLGRFFQSSLSRGAEYVTVKEEEAQIKSYLEIQKIRYKSKLDYQICLESEILSYNIVHLALQPLVENAIYHGIKEVERPGMIVISGSKICLDGRDCLRFTVTDNGLGIEKEKLALINDKLEKGIVDSNVGYGIFNVNERVRLSYGSGFGLRLESIYNETTSSVLTIPAIAGNAVEVKEVIHD